MRDLKFCQSEAIICAKDKNVQKAMQLTENELEVQYIWQIFLQT